MTDADIRARLRAIGRSGPRAFIEAQLLLDEIGRGDWLDRIHKDQQATTDTGRTMEVLGMLHVKLVILGVGPSPLAMLADCANDDA